MNNIENEYMSGHQQNKRNEEDDNVIYSHHSTADMGQFIKEVNGR
jgi:hypothetical protein